MLKSASFLARIAFVAALAVNAAAQFGGQPIQWLNVPNVAGNQAQQSLRPILIYVSGDAESRATDLDERQQRALRTPDIIRIVNTHFVPLRLSRTTQTMPLMAQLGLPVNYGQYVAVVPPDTFVPNSGATKIALIDAMSLADASILAGELMKAHRAYGEQLYGDQIKPLFEKEEITPADMNKALGIINTYSVSSADVGVLKLLEKNKDSKNKKLLKDLYGTLGSLSTQKAGEFLWEQAKDGSKDAQDALTQLNPVTMERVLIPQLRADDPATRYLAYKTIARAMNLKPLKQEKWWLNAKEKQINDEIEKISQAVSAAAVSWKDGPGRYRG